MVKKIIIIIFACLQISVGQFKVGKYSGEFLATGFGSRALAMGGANVALVNDVTSTYWNPSALAMIKNSEISIMHDERFGSLVNFDYVGFGLPYGKNYTKDEIEIDNNGNVIQKTEFEKESYAISLTRLGVDGIPDTRKAWADSNSNGIFDEYSRPELDKITYFNAADWVMYLTYAKQKNENLFFGANVKLIRREMSEIGAFGIGIDLGALYLLNENLNFGISAQDISTTLLFWSTGRNEVILPTVKIGGAYQKYFWRGKFSFTSDLDFRFEGRENTTQANLKIASMDPRFGIEYDYENLIAIRSGIDDNKRLTMGAGIHLRKMDLDYSFLKFNGSSELGNSHRISIRIKIDN